MQHGKQILNLSASFQITEDGWQHHHPMPQVKGPEGLNDRHVLRQQNVDKIPEQYRKDYVRPRPIEVRELAPIDHFNPQPAPDLNHLWFRMHPAAGQSPQMQHCLLAYASDMNLLGSSLRPSRADVVQGWGDDCQFGSCNVVSCASPVRSMASVHHGQPLYWRWVRF